MNQAIGITNPTILVIEDDFELREILYETFKKQNWKCFFAVTMEAIREIVKEAHVVLMDWNVPGLDHQEVLKACTGKKVLVMTGDIDCDHPYTISKPFTFGSLIEKIKVLVAPSHFQPGDYVRSRSTPYFGVGVVVKSIDNAFYLVRFPNGPSDIKDKVIKCHETNLAQNDLKKT